MSPAEYIELKRGDILTREHLSASAREMLRMTALDIGPCEEPGQACIDAMYQTTSVSEENKRATLAELWLQHALSLGLPEHDRVTGIGAPARSVRPLDSVFLARLDAWMGVARESYAYLFFTERTAGDRAFVDRQTQVRDYYNLAVQEVSVLLFEANARGVHSVQAGATHVIMKIGKWTFHIWTNTGNEGVDKWEVSELIPALSMEFKGSLRRFHRRDGVGAELVAVKNDVVSDTRISSSGGNISAGIQDQSVQTPRNWSEIPTPAVSILLRFSGSDLSEILTDDAPELYIYDPYKMETVEIHGERVPLAANFTAAYGLWLARSNFSRQALDSLFGGENGIDRPHLFLMQPYDPDRRVILMIHGLASSPEAWVNMANELMRDNAIRNEFQIWQMYYPTSMPIPMTHNAVRRILSEVLLAFDPSGKARISSGMVLVGHSMGGVISRLMVSSSGDTVWDRWVANCDLDSDSLQKLQITLSPLMHFDPVPQIERVVFIATPHRGTEVTATRLSRWIGQMIKLPVSALQDTAYLLKTSSYGNSREGRSKVPMATNSLDSLDKNDPFMMSTVDLPISPAVRYHSIIARMKADGPLEDSDDGVVPYWSSHLVGAESEKIIQSGHSVQEETPAIVELRRILHEDIREYGENRSDHLLPD